ncbi:MAG TPA: PAS domain S-box protein [Caulobacteraceae bacterium]|jgi:PAS domain S-box-containing protein
MTLPAADYRPSNSATALTGAEARYRAIVDTAVDAILVVDDGGTVISFNPAAERLFGYRADEIIGRSVRLLAPPGHACARRDHLPDGERPAVGGGRRVEGLRKDGSVCPLELSVAEWRADGRRYFTGVLRDISERLRAEESQRLLLGELNHRVKNSLATVQAVVGNTLRHATDLEGAREALNGRLLALAKGHDILTRESWEGADLADVIDEAIDTHGEPERFSVETLRQRLSPKVALAMSMALYELCTNAAKYGALSVEGGRVSIAVTRQGGALNIVWREIGGPPVEPPTRRGFGSRMLQGLARDLEGAARLDFAPDGLVCVITAPLAQTRGGDGPAGA